MQATKTPAKARQILRITEPDANVRTERE